MMKKGVYVFIVVTCMIKLCTGASVNENGSSFEHFQQLTEEGLKEDEQSIFLSGVQGMQPPAQLCSSGQQILGQEILSEIGTDLLSREPVSDVSLTNVGNRSHIGLPNGVDALSPTLTFSAVASSIFPEQVSFPHKGFSLKQYPCGMLRGFPDMFCPLRGAVMAENGSLRRLYKKGSVNSIVRRLFNLIELKQPFLYEQVVLTGKHRNPLMGLSPKIAGKLLRMTSDEKDLSLLYKVANSVGDEPFLTEWHSEYLKRFSSVQGELSEKTLLRNPTNFRKEARNFLRALYAEALGNLQPVRDLLLAYLYVRISETLGDKIEMLQEYAQGLGMVFDPAGNYTDQDFIEIKKVLTQVELTPEESARYTEATIFFVSRLNNDEVKSHLFFNSYENAVYKGQFFPLCTENFLRTMVSLVCYNPCTGRLDSAMLSQSAQQSLTPQLKKFITQYADLNEHSFASQQAWLELVEELPDLPYNIENKFELVGSIRTGTRVLEILFGVLAEKVGTDAEQFANLLKKLNNRITVTINRVELSGIEDNSFDITLTGEKDFSLTLYATWGVSAPAHAQVRFPELSEAITDVLCQNFFLIGKEFGKFILGTTSLTCAEMLNALMKKGALKNQQDFLSFFDSYVSKKDVSNVPKLFYTSSYWPLLTFESVEVVENFLVTVQELCSGYPVPLCESKLSHALLEYGTTNKNSELIQLLFKYQFISCTAMIMGLMQTGSLKTEEDFLNCFKNCTDAAGVNQVPAIFYDSSWSVLIPISSDVLQAFFSAAQKKGYKCNATLEKSGISKIIFDSAVENLDSVLLNSLFQDGLEPSKTLLTEILLQMKGSSIKKNILKSVAFIKVFYSYGFTEKDVARIVLETNNQSKLSLVKELGVDLSAPLMDKELTPLMFAAVHANTSLFERLVQQGANLRDSDNSKTTFFRCIMNLVNREIGDLFDEDSSTEMSFMWARDFQKILSYLSQECKNKNLVEMTLEDFEELAAVEQQLKNKLDLYKE